MAPTLDIANIPGLPRTAADPGDNRPLPGWVVDLFDLEAGVLGYCPLQEAFTEFCAWLNKRASVDKDCGQRPSSCSFIHDAFYSGRICGPLARARYAKYRKGGHDDDTKA